MLVIGFGWIEIPTADWPEGGYKIEVSGVINSESLTARNYFFVSNTSVESIDLAENRDKFSQVLNKINLKQTDNGSAMSAEKAKKMVVYCLIAVSVSGAGLIIIRQVIHQVH